ncbi:recombination protein RecT [Halobacillus sp. BAB-2008]|uniref:recombination protein RecT n=1 Tax=Halobacillus sp. BAB-2008 TaxID=1246484 RepID=UPI0002A4F693|nr:recombination protein RecT [Halobacillus sp. BAB-2008]ELK47210.1 recombination and repair protein RecT [Halobacillus sp. BAB-2008]
MATNSTAKNQLANKKNSSNAPQQSNNQVNTIQAYLKKMGPEFERALPKHMDADRLGRIAMTTIRQNPKLLECSIPSLMGAVMQAAQLGLEPGLIGHCYLVPFYNGKMKETDVQFIIGYKGMIDLARRSGHIESIYAHTVHDNDEFEYELGLHPKLVHKPSTGERGDMNFVYAVAHFKDGGYQFEVFSRNDVDKVKERSKAGKFGPWQTDYEEMAKKTVIRRMFKYLPISVEIQNQATNDETVRKDVTEDPESVYEKEFIDIPTQEEDSQQEEEKRSDVSPEQAAMDIE